VRAVLVTPDHIIAEVYAGRCTAPDALGVRPAEAAVWEESTLSVTGSREEHWSGLGHYPHEEQPERTVRLVREWAGTV